MPTTKEILESIRAQKVTPEVKESETISPETKTILESIRKQPIVEKVIVSKEPSSLLEETKPKEIGLLSKETFKALPETLKEQPEILKFGISAAAEHFVPTLLLNAFDKRFGISEKIENF